MRKAFLAAATVRAACGRWPCGHGLRSRRGVTRRRRVWGGGLASRVMVPGRMGMGRDS